MKFAGNLAISTYSCLRPYGKNGARKTFGLNCRVRSLLCIIFAWETACQKYFFQILSQKNADVINLKNPDLDLVRSILLECRYFEFMVRQRKLELKRDASVKHTLSCLWYVLQKISGWSIQSVDSHHLNIVNYNPSNIFTRARLV